MGDLMLDGSVAVLVAAFVAWVALGALVLLGRARHDLGERRSGREAPLSEREASRLVRRAGRAPRTEWGSWRRALAVTRLARSRHPSTPRLVRALLCDRHPRIVDAAVRALGELGDEWAIELLVSALREGRGSRSRVAAELDRLAPRPGPLLPPLLRDPSPVVRFWGATLLARYPDLGGRGLVALAWDPDPNVRAAVAETLGERGGREAGTALLALLGDPQWFVRVHAARAAGKVLGAEAAPTLCELLSDDRWWVRTAAKDALRGIGPEAVRPLLSVLTHADRFARNGAAEVLQDIGFVDTLALEHPASPLLARIYAAGGDGMRAATEQRVAAATRRRRLRVA